MKRILALAAVLAALTACTAEEEKPDFTGYYELSEIVSETNGASAEQIQELREYGYVCSFQVNADGTAVMDMYGEIHEMGWNNDGFWYDSDPKGIIAYEYADGTLSLMDSENRLVFTRAENAGLNINVPDVPGPSQEPVPDPVVESPEEGKEYRNGIWSYIVTKDSSGNIVYNIDNGSVYLTLPADWEGCYDVDFTQQYRMTFYHAKSRLLWASKGYEDQGNLFSLVWSAEDDFSHLPSYKYLGEGAQYGYYHLEFPTDVQGYQDDQACWEEYLMMQKGVNSVKESAYCTIKH
ncbi:MAG: hypothetical protein IJH98_05815 [Solobacterium sp.]|nr:hypothetical protein [Solobacterium sp.]